MNHFLVEYHHRPVGLITPTQYSGDRVAVAAVLESEAEPGPESRDHGMPSHADGSPEP
jgi:hypothetical protein